MEIVHVNKGAWALICNSLPGLVAGSVTAAA
jgi:hypothetical protein